ncbi:complex I subunit 4 family protein [Algoriella sp.]|uniref:complex I subunit 4 family protein n=1 Tax=Algoriella sp. TaxID=1872434 RepID=UPI002FC90983
MLLSLFIILPLIVGVFMLLMKGQKPQRWLGAFVGGALLALYFFITCKGGNDELTYQTQWFNFNSVKTYFALNAQGLGGLMLLLSNFTYLALFVYLSTSKQNYSNTFYGLLLITLAGLNGVFLAEDLILFYFFWEVVLIPVYFLIGLFGLGKDRLRANMTFFLYTILGSMFMLGGIIYIGFFLKPASFLLADVQQVTAAAYSTNTALALLFLIAFVIKIPIFPFHTWQPTIYKTSPTPLTVVLSALMAKMGLFAVVTWYLGMFPEVSVLFKYIMYIAIFGLVYASLIALSAKNVKKIIAYSSIAHLALIFVSLFSELANGITGAYFQMFSHGLVVLGLWLCVDIMERKYHLTDIKSIGGLAKVDPTLAILFMVFGLANVALPLTSSFIGEFMMLSALFTFNPVLCVVACLGVILSAVYTLRLSGALLFGEVKNIKQKEAKKGGFGPIAVLSVIAIVIIILGVYPTPIFNLLAH